MSVDNDAVTTEVRGLGLALDGENLLVTTGSDPLIAPCPLTEEDADRLRLEMAKAQLWEWNQFDQAKARAELRYRRYLGSWLVMCLEAFSVYVGFPDYYLPIVFALVSIFLWWRAGYEEQRAEREAQAERNRFRPEWEYIRQRLESDEVGVR